jgi:plasmid stabilization system protein ParE
MTFSTLRADIERIVRWLRSNDETDWDEQTRSLSQTIADLQELPRTGMGVAETIGSKERRSAEAESFSPEATAIHVAMPQLVQMLGAMHIRNRELAVKHGEEALGLLPEE